MTIKKTPILLLLSLCFLTGCIIPTWSTERINKTYSVRYVHGVDYYSTTIRAHGRKLAELADSLYLDETSWKDGWNSYALLEKENVLFFVSWPRNIDEGLCNHLLVSINGAKPLDITEHVREWAWQRKDYTDKSALIGLGPLKVEGDQLMIGLYCDDSALKMNRTTSIPLSVIHEFIAQSQPPARTK